MAEKIETIMERGTAFVTHQGKEIEVKTPDWFNVTMDEWYDRDKLITFLESHEILMATLHKGFEQHLIDIRSKARPKDLPPEEKGGNPIPQQIEQADAQKRVDAYKPEPRKQTDSKVEKAGKDLAGMTDQQKRQTLKIAGFTDEQIEAIMNS